MKRHTKHVCGCLLVAAIQIASAIGVEARYGDDRQDARFWKAAAGQPAVALDPEAESVGEPAEDALVEGEPSLTDAPSLPPFEGEGAPLEGEATPKSIPPAAAPAAQHPARP